MFKPRTDPLLEDTEIPNFVIKDFDFLFFVRKSYFLGYVCCRCKVLPNITVEDKNTFKNENLKKKKKTTVSRVPFFRKSAISEQCSEKHRFFSTLKQVKLKTYLRKKKKVLSFTPETKMERKLDTCRLHLYNFENISTP